MLNKKEYLLVEVGGPNGQIWNEVDWFGDVDEVIEYSNRKEICDDNGVRFRNSYDEKNWEREDYICEVYADEIEGKIVGVYLINEGLELIEIEEDPKDKLGTETYPTFMIRVNDKMVDTMIGYKGKDQMEINLNKY